jgi:hypothetical protein
VGDFVGPICEILFPCEKAKSPPRINRDELKYVALLANQGKKGAKTKWQILAAKLVSLAS